MRLGTPSAIVAPGVPLDQGTRQLQNLREDFSLANALAPEHANKLEELQALFAKKAV